MKNKDIETFAYTIKKIKTVNFEYKEITEKELNFLMSQPDYLKIKIDVDWKIFKNDSKIEIDFISKLIRNSDREVLFQHTGRTIFNFLHFDFFFEVVKS